MHQFIYSMLYRKNVYTVYIGSNEGCTVSTAYLCIKSQKDDKKKKNLFSETNTYTLIKAMKVLVFYPLALPPPLVSCLCVLLTTP